MNLIVCVDDHGGMAFNHRRQSRDQRQRQYLDEMIKGKTLWMSPYTAKLYLPSLPDVDCRIHEEPIQQAGDREYVLCERENLTDYGDVFDSVILFRWNRSYPYDTVFPQKLLQNMKRIQTLEVKGSSHDSITVEVYQR